MVLGLSKFKKTKAMKQSSMDTMIVVKDDATTTTELSDLSESCRSHPAVVLNKQKKQSRTGTSLFRNVTPAPASAPASRIHTNTPAVNEQINTLSIAGSDDDDDSVGTYNGEQPFGCGLQQSTFNDFEVPMNDDKGFHNSNLLDMEVPAKDGFPEDSLRYTFSEKSKSRFVNNGFPEDSLRYTFDERAKYGCGADIDASSETAAERITVPPVSLDVSPTEASPFFSFVAGLDLPNAEESDTSV